MSEQVDSTIKVKKLEELQFIAAGLKKRGKKIVHCHGVFDLLHLGHIRYLNSARSHGDVLIVTLTADKHVKRGPGRPVFNHNLRAEALANLAMTDFVSVVDEPTAVAAIRAIAPDFYVKGPDYRDKSQDVTAKIYDEEEAVSECGGKLVFTDDITFSSSQLINLHLDTYPEHVTKYLRRMAAKYSADQIVSMLGKAQAMKILVIGDAIIDQYHYVAALGKSPKENIVVHRYISEEDFAGGTLATANHTAQLCENVELISMLGEKNSHEDFVRAHLDHRIKPTLHTRVGTTTTVKRRFVSEDGSRKLFEVAFIDDHPLSRQEEKPLLEFLDKNITNYDLVIVNDFGHGMLTRHVIDTLCSRAKCLALNAQTNSANVGFNLITKYLRADFVCIDEHEMRLATGDKHKELGDLVKMIARLLMCKQVLVTRGARGALSYTEEEGIIETPAFAERGIDKVGAGDAFFAYAAPCFALGMPQELTSFIGNAVGALKIQILGNREPVKLPDLIKFITRMLKV